MLKQPATASGVAFLGGALLHAAGEMGLIGLIGPMGFCVFGGGVGKKDVLFHNKTSF